jgi:hypothetical protein
MMLQKIYSMTHKEIYLSWCNDFLTIQGFASYYGISKSKASFLITAATEEFFKN